MFLEDGEWYKIIIQTEIRDIQTSVELSIYFNGDTYLFVLSGCVTVRTEEHGADCETWLTCCQGETTGSKTGRHYVGIDRQWEVIEIYRCAAPPSNRLGSVLYTYINVHPLKDEIHLNDVQKFNSYLEIENIINTTSRLTLFREIIVVCYHTEHINTLCVGKIQSSFLALKQVLFTLSEAFLRSIKAIEASTVHFKCFSNSTVIVEYTSLYYRPLPEPLYSSSSMLS
jgi:hypothetical protein